MPLLQTINVTFGKLPIPFAKTSFPPQSLKGLIDNIKKRIESGKSWVDEFKKNYINPLKTDLNTGIENLRKFTDNDFAELKKALPEFYANGVPAVVTARNELMALLGNVQTVTSQSVMGMPTWNQGIVGNSLYETFQYFVNHTNEISGVAPEDKTIITLPLYGKKPIVNATVNLNSTVVAVANTSKPAYPVVNIGETVIVNNQERVVVGKNYSTVSGGGTVYVNTITDNTKFYTASVATLNLASTLTAGMYVNVGSQFRQVSTINALGDFATVRIPFGTSIFSPGISLQKEVSFNVNTAFTTTSSDQIVYVKSAFIANSLCLDNVITGVGTTFNTDLAVDDKIIYDDKEYFVIAVTATTITVDDSLFYLNDQPVAKVVNEYPMMRLTDGNSPDDILSAFSALDGLTNSMSENYSKDLVTRYRAANGKYVTVSANTPLNVTKSLEKSQEAKLASMFIQNIIDSLSNEAIRGISESALVTEITRLKNEAKSIKDELDNSIAADRAAINAVKGLLNGMLRLFNTSCSKKKSFEGDNSSDLYLELITMPDPSRLGCDATESDLIDIYDEADNQFKDPGVTPGSPVEFTDDNGGNRDELNDPNESETDGSFADEEETNPGEDGDIDIDNQPELPAKPEDPCSQPC
jgi:hypothetical protein